MKVIKAILNGILYLIVGGVIHWPVYLACYYLGLIGLPIKYNAQWLMEANPWLAVGVIILQVLLFIMFIFCTGRYALKGAKPANIAARTGIVALLNAPYIIAWSAFAP